MSFNFFYLNIHY